MDRSSEFRPVRTARKLSRDWWRASVCWGLVLLVISSCVAFAQTPQPKFRIEIRQGDMAEGPIKDRRPRTAQIIVQVKDENDRPVAGAVVLFTLPDRGPSGTFPDGSRTVMMMTDSQGMARAPEIQANGVPGRVEILVQASHQGQSATIAITQINTGKTGMGPGTKAAVFGGLSAAAATALVVLLGKGGPTVTRDTTNLAIRRGGSPSVGGP
jgi:hypothetical protein